MNEKGIKLFELIRKNIIFKNINIKYIDDDFKTIEHRLDTTKKDINMYVKYKLKFDSHESKTENKIETISTAEVELMMNDDSYKIGEIQCIIEDLTYNEYKKLLDDELVKEDYNVLNNSRELLFKVVVVERVINSIIENVSRYINFDIIGSKDDQLNDVIIDTLLKIRNAFETGNIKKISDIINENIPLMRTEEDFEKFVSQLQRHVPEISDINILFNPDYNEDNEDDENNESCKNGFKINPDLLN